jgi:hypothetical protein
MASRKRLQELTETITEQAIDTAESPGDSLFCSSKEWFDLIHLDGEERQRKLAEIAARPPSVPEPPLSPEDLTDIAQGALNRAKDLEQEAIRLESRVCDLEDRVSDYQERIANLERASRQQVDMIHGLMARVRDGGE